MHCVAKYPHSREEASELMPKAFEGPLEGYSDHSLGVAAVKQAIERGATVIEKHFTLSHDLQCDTESAHICSMNLKQLKEIKEFCDIIER